MMKRAGKLYPQVILASPGRQPPMVRHSTTSSGPAARWIAPSTPPPPSSVVFAAFTIASTSSLVMSPRARPISVPRFFTSRREPFDQPTAVSLPSVTKTVVQAIRAALPEFHCIGFYSITTPVRRQGNGIVAKAFGHLYHACIQHAASIEHFALARRPCAEMAAHRPGMKIALRFLMRRFLRFPANANLSIQFNPIKCQRSVRIGFELHSLFAFVIREKNETVLVESFQQHHAHGRFCVAPSGSETHRVDVANLGFNCRSEPV